MTFNIFNSSTLWHISTYSLIIKHQLKPRRLKKIQKHASFTNCQKTAKCIWEKWDMGMHQYNQNKLFGQNLIQYNSSFIISLFLKNSRSFLIFLYFLFMDILSRLLYGSILLNLILKMTSDLCVLSYTNKFTIWLLQHPSLLPWLSKQKKGTRSSIHRFFCGQQPLQENFQLFLEF